MRLALSARGAALRADAVNDRYPLRESSTPASSHRKRQVFVEYLMLDGVNDRYEQARALADLLHCRGMRSR